MSQQQNNILNTSYKCNSNVDSSSDIDIINLSDPRLHLLLIGEVGSGKSAFGNALLKSKKFNESPENPREGKPKGPLTTTEIQIDDGDCYGFPGYIIDTPGFEISNNQQKEKIDQITKKVLDDPYLVGICIVVDSRLKIINVKIAYLLKKIMKDFKDDSWIENIAFIFTNFSHSRSKDTCKQVEGHCKKMIDNFFSIYFENSVPKNKIDNIKSYFVDCPRIKNHNGKSRQQTLDMLEHFASIQTLYQKQKSMIITHKAKEIVSEEREYFYKTYNEVKSIEGDTVFDHNTNIETKKVRHYHITHNEIWSRIKITRADRSIEYTEMSLEKDEQLIVYDD